MGNQTTYLNTVTLSEFTDLVRHEWVTSKEFLTRNARQLFIADPVGAGQGKTKRYDEVDMDTYADFKAEGTNSSKARGGVGYNVTMTARSFSKEIGISWEMRLQNRYPEVGAMLTSLTQFCENRQDLDLTHRLTFATSTSYTDMNGESVSTAMGDTLSLANAAHTLLFSSTTYRNRVSGDPVFSQGAYEAAKLLTTTDIYNNFGDRRVMNFDVIFSGDDPGTVRSIQQFIASTTDVDQTNPGIVNVYKGKVRHVILPQLATTATGATDSTKRRWWGIAATGMMGWQAYVGDWATPELLTPARGNNGEDIHNYDWTFSARCMYGIAVVSGRGIVMSCPTS